MDKISMVLNKKLWYIIENTFEKCQRSVCEMYYWTYRTGGYEWTR